MEADPPDIDQALYGWLKDIVNKVLVAVGLPDNVSTAPEAVLNMIKCACSSTSPCSTKRCSCSSANVSCSITRKYRGDPVVCHNGGTQRAALAEPEQEVVADKDTDEDGQ